jgi:hypothetical protein
MRTWYYRAHQGNDHYTGPRTSYLNKKNKNKKTVITSRIIIDQYWSNFNYTELLGLFWTLFIVLYVEDKRPQRFRDWICLHPQVDGAG